MVARIQPYLDTATKEETHLEVFAVGIEVDQTLVFITQELKRTETMQNVLIVVRHDTTNSNADYVLLMKEKNKPWVAKDLRMRVEKETIQKIFRWCPHVS